MEMINLTERLAAEIGAALREPEFQELFGAVSAARRETVVSEQMARRRIDARLVALTAAPPGMAGDYKIVWQPNAGGAEQTQWFTPE